MILTNLKKKFKMRTDKYYGTWWVIFEGSNPRLYDDFLYFRFQNLWLLKKEFNLFSLSFKHGFEVTLLSFSIKILAN